MVERNKVRIPWFGINKLVTIPVFGRNKVRISMVERNKVTIPVFGITKVTITVFGRIRSEFQYLERPGHNSSVWRKKDQNFNV